MPTRWSTASRRPPSGCSNPPTSADPGTNYCAPAGPSGGTAMPADPRTDTGPAEVIICNGRVATQDDRRSSAQAVAIRGGRFSAVGADQDVLKHRGDQTQVID